MSRTINNTQYKVVPDNAPTSDFTSFSIGDSEDGAIVYDTTTNILMYWNGTKWVPSTQLVGYTVATLPTGVEGDRAYVTDATAPAYNTALTGGGAVVVPVFKNATIWVSA